MCRTEGNSSNMRQTFTGNMDVTIVPGEAGIVGSGGVSQMGMQLLGNKSHQWYQCSAVI